MCKKLTAERARERIEHLKTWQKQRGLTLREEEYLEALELAMPVLEHRECMKGSPCSETCTTDSQYESLSVQAALGHGLERYGDAMKKLVEND